MFLVVEPGTRSVKAAREIDHMAGEMGVRNRYVLGNKVRSTEDEAFLKTALEDFRFAWFLPLHGDTVDAERRGEALYKHSPAMRERIGEILRAVDL